MRNNKLYILLVLVAVFFAACEETSPDILVGGDATTDLSGRSYSTIDPPVSVPFFYQGTSSITIDLGKYEQEGSSIANVQVTKTLTAGGVTSDPVVYSVVAAELTQSLSELFADVPIDGQVLIEDSLAPGDFWTFSYVVNLDGNSPTEAGILTIAQTTTVPFSCVSAIPTEGTWTGETQNGAFGVFSTNDEVTLEAIDENGNYKMSDITGGFYAAFGYDPNNPGNINDLCNFITVTGAPDAQFAVGNTGLEGPGFWDSSTETLTVTWYDNLNDIDEVTIHTRN